MRLEQLQLNSKDRTVFKNLMDSEIDDLIDKLILPGEVMNSQELLIDTSENPRTFKEVAVLTDGAAFGELALINERPRMATIKCIERCHFLVLNKEEYNTAINEIKRR